MSAVLNAAHDAALLLCVLTQSAAVLPLASSDRSIESQQRPQHFSISVTAGNGNTNGNTNGDGSGNGSYNDNGNNNENGSSTDCGNGDGHGYVNNTGNGIFRPSR